MIACSPPCWVCQRQYPISVHFQVHPESITHLSLFQTSYPSSSSQVSVIFPSAASSSSTRRVSSREKPARLIAHHSAYRRRHGHPHLHNRLTVLLSQDFRGSDLQWPNGLQHGVGISSQTGWIRGFSDQLLKPAGFRVWCCG